MARIESAELAECISAAGLVVVEMHRIELLGPKKLVSGNGDR